MRLRCPVKHGGVPYIWRDDLARAPACTQDGHSGLVYQQTVREAVSMPELASALRRAARKAVSATAKSEVEFGRIYRAEGPPDDAIEILTSTLGAADNRELERVARDAERLPARPLSA